MSKLFKLALLLGVGSTGYFVGWSLAKRRYENLADIEVESVKVKLTEHYEELLNKVPEKGSKKPIQDKTKKSSAIKPALSNDDDGMAYTDYAKKYQTPESEGRIVNRPEKITRPLLTADRPYVIDSQEYMESTYEAKTLLYFTDKTLADEDYNVIHDVENEVGYDNLTKFGEYDSDCVYVRNERLGIDYEILLDQRIFASVVINHRTGAVGGEDE